MREILKQILYILSKITIKKHDIKFVVISGWFDSALAKELLYTVFSDHMTVRRNTIEVWWDLSVPLNILGYEDVQRSAWKWFGVIFSSMFALIKNSKNPHYFILSIDTERTETANYWNKLINPEMLVVLNRKVNDPFTDKIIDTAVLNGSKIVADIDDIPQFRDQKSKLMTFSDHNSEADLYYKKYKEKLKFKLKDEEVSIPLKKWKQYPPEVWASVISASFLEGFTLEETILNAIKFDLKAAVFDKIKSNLELSLS